MSNSLLGLEGKGVVVTGAGQGGGRGIALQFAKAGARVAVVDLDESLARKVAGELQVLGAESVAVRADATDPDSVARMVERSLEALGGLDVGVNNVGNFGAHRPQPVLDQGTEFWDTAVAQNLRTTFLGSQAFARSMIERGVAGAIVNVASLSGLRGSINLAPYGAAKAGVMQFTQTLALELAPHRIRVNCVAPTSIDTPSYAAGTTPERRAATEASIPLGRLCDPEELGGAVVMLASDLAAFVTGQTLPCDGGLSVTIRRPPIAPE
ncbi:MAG: SDR family oxidoreductase [Proteobacteria bacterium]|nr:SDR family oxidoreductase [Pseudomonadota bacterium]